VVSFTPRPLYPWGKNNRYPLDRRLYSTKYYRGDQTKDKATGETNVHIRNVLVRKPEWEGPFWKPRCRWNNDDEMNLKQLGFGGVEWVHKKLRIKSSGGTF
jgi:hypothetical protein